MNKQTLSIFKMTQDIIEKAETTILNHKYEGKLKLLFLKEFIFPIKYLHIGWDDLFKPVAKFFFMSFVLFIAIAMLINYFSLPQFSHSFLFNLSIIFPMILVIFSMPSTYAYYGVKKKNIEIIVNHLQKFNIENIDTIEIIESNLEKIYLRVLSRISMFKWLLASSWALFTLILNQKLKISLKIPEENLATIFINNISTISIFIFFTLLILIIITGYKRASEMLFKSIEFGLADLKGQLVQRQQNGVKNL